MSPLPVQLHTLPAGVGEESGPEPCHRTNRCLPPPPAPPPNPGRHGAQPLPLPSCCLAPGVNSSHALQWLSAAGQRVHGVPWHGPPNSREQPCFHWPVLNSTWVCEGLPAACVPFLAGLGGRLPHCSLRSRGSGSIPGPPAAASLELLAPLWGLSMPPEETVNTAQLWLAAGASPHPPVQEDPPGPRKAVGLPSAPDRRGG